MEQDLIQKSETEINSDTLNQLDISQTLTGQKISLDLLFSLFNASLDKKEIKSIRMILDKKKNLVKLKLKKNKKTSAHPKIKNNKKYFVLFYKVNPSDYKGDFSKELQGLAAQNLGLIPGILIPDKLPISIIRTPDALLIYAEILYNQEPELEGVIYEEKFDPLNRYQESYQGFNTTKVSIENIDNATESINKETYLRPTDMFKEDVFSTIEQPKVLIIEYEQPRKINSLDIYEEVFLRNLQPQITVKDILLLTGLEYEITRIEDFDGSDYITAFDNKRDGENNRYWEVLINGQYANKSIDKQPVDEGDVVTFRLAENKAGCGGSYQEELTDLTMLLTKQQKVYTMKNNSGRMPWYMTA